MASCHTLLVSSPVDIPFSCFLMVANFQSRLGKGMDGWILWLVSWFSSPFVV